MCFSRYKALTRLAQITLGSTESAQNPARRFYSKKLILSSSSPHKLKTRISLNQAPSTGRKKGRGAAYASKGRGKEQPTDEDYQFTEEVFEEVQEVVEDYTGVVHGKQKVKKYNYRLADLPYYQQNLPSDEQTTEEVQLEQDPNTVDRKISTALSNEDKEHSLNSTQTEVEVEESRGEVYDELNIEKDFSRFKIIQSPEGELKFDLSSDEFSLEKFYKELNDTLTVPKPLDTCKEDLSSFGPNFPPTFNFAAYADKSKLIQEFVKLGVKLYKVEKNQDHMRALLTVDLEKELPVYIQFLHDCGVPADSLGDVITENPMILKEDLDDMKTRIRYLRAHEFAKESIARIVTKNPTWLVWATKKIDERLGHFQNEFNLTGPEIRFLATKQPKLITYSIKHILENTFAMKEEMGFKNDQRKVLLLAKPRLWMSTRKKIIDSFDYLHNSMNLSHLMIASQPDLLACRRSRLKNRHEFLVELKKVQYDPQKPGYIAPQRIAFGSDVEFCRDIAKTSVETYNLFLKTR